MWRDTCDVTHATWQKVGKWGIPEKSIKNVAQRRWNQVRRSLKSKVMARYGFSEFCPLWILWACEGVQFQMKERFLAKTPFLSIDRGQNVAQKSAASFKIPTLMLYGQVLFAQVLFDKYFSSVSCQNENLPLTWYQHGGGGPALSLFKFWNGGKKLSKISLCWQLQDVGVLWAQLRGSSRRRSMCDRVLPCVTLFYSVLQYGIE